MVGDEVTAEELNDQIGNEQVPTCIVMPTNLYRQIWEFLMALSLFQNAIYICVAAILCRVSSRAKTHSTSGGV